MIKRLYHILLNIAHRLNRIGVSTVNDSSAAVNCANQTWTNILTFTVPAGNWLVIATGVFASNATGRRHFVISTSSSAGGATPTYGYRMIDTKNAVNGAYTTSRISTVYNNASATTLYLVAWQNSGNTLGVTPRLQMVRLK